MNQYSERALGDPTSLSWSCICKARRSPPLDLWMDMQVAFKGGGTFAEDVGGTRGRIAEGVRKRHERLNMGRNARPPVVVLAPGARRLRHGLVAGDVRIAATKVFDFLAQQLHQNPKPQ